MWIWLKQRDLINQDISLDENQQRLKDAFQHASFTLSTQLGLIL